MDSIYDIRQLLKKFGIYIYTGDRIGDLELMSIEIDELFHLGIIKMDIYRIAKYLLRKEIRILKEKDE